jgi:D-alanine-D-alanine ligase
MKLRLTLVYGGPSSEHEVSESSAQNILKNLDQSKYDVRAIKINKKGEWETEAGNLSESDALDCLKDKTDLVFNIIHGTYGEDGYLQSLLEAKGIPFTGSDSISSKLGMDKLRSFELYKKNGLLVADYFVVDQKDAASVKFDDLPYSVAVVKPYDNGSSVGVHIVRNQSEFDDAIDETLKMSSKAIVQEYIKGKEVTCGVLDIKNVPTALAPTEIRATSGDFFDYKSKYVKGASVEITPAEISEIETKEVKRQSILAHKITGCRGVTRSDFIITEDGKIYILEINTIPGMTKTSLIPQGAEAVGIKIGPLLDFIIDSARVN